MSTASAPLRAAQAAAALLPRRTVELPVKSVGDDGSFELYGAVFGNVDRQGDVIEVGAFTNLDEFSRDGWIALNHQQAELPVGYPTAAVQDETGLLIRGSFHSTPEAQACRTVVKERMAAGKAVKCSVGYLTIDESYEKRDGQQVRSLKKIAVYEVSFVNLPANPAAEVVSVKAQGADAMPEAKPDPKPEVKDLVLEALKEFKELLIKSEEDGDGVPKSAVTRMKAFAEEMHEHGQKSKEHAKCINEHAKAACEMSRGMKACIKNFTGGQQQEVDEDNDGNDAESGKKKKAQRVEEDEREEQESDGADGAKSEDDDEEKTRKAFAAQLRERSRSGRCLVSCP